MQDTSQRAFDTSIAELIGSSWRPDNSNPVRRLVVRAPFEGNDVQALSCLDSQYSCVGVNCRIPDLFYLQIVDNEGFMQLPIDGRMYFTDDVKISQGLIHACGSAVNRLLANFPVLRIAGGYGTEGPVHFGVEIEGVFAQIDTDLWNSKVHDACQLVRLLAVIARQANEMEVLSPPMGELYDIAWSTLKDAYNDASAVPRYIRQLRSVSAQQVEWAFDDLRATIWHQGTVYEATAFAIPFLYMLIEEPSFQWKAPLLEFLRYIGEGHPEPESVKPVIDSELAKGLALVCELTNDNDPETSEQASYLADLLRSQ